MRTLTLTLSMLALGLTALRAQTVATFDTLHLSKADTFYVNYSAPGTDVGFNDGLAHFPTLFDTSGGYSFLSYGFIYSNMTDSVTSGYMNQYSAKAAKGYDTSANYVVAYGSENIVNLTGAAIGNKVSGFYATNNTYAYNSMRDGDAYGKIFNGHDSDWYKLEVRGFRNGQLTTDSVDFYLADFRHADTTQNYIVRDWRWVDLSSLGHVDSLQFSLSSSDTAGGAGMNTPAYFCIDNFTTNETNTGIKNIPAQFAAKVYPNPAINTLYVELADKAITQARVLDMSGKEIAAYNVTGSNLSINTSSYNAGVYILQLTGGTQVATTRFVKQ